MQPLDALSRSWSSRVVRGMVVSLALGAIGCGPEANPASTEPTTGSTSTTTGSGASTSTTDPCGVTVHVTSSTSSSTTSEPTPTSFDPCDEFLVCPADVVGGVICDVFGQGCPEGEKCEAVFIDGGDSWNSARCVPVTGTDVPGDPCTAESVADGLDSCVKGAMCWGVDMDGNGTCVALCTGTADAPLCPNMGACTIVNDGFINLCLPSCDPLLQDCADGDACYPLNDGFACAPNASGDTGKANDPCEFINVCQPGLLCAGPEYVGAGCPPGSQGCCTPFCEFPDGACPNPDQHCMEWFDPMMLPVCDPKLAIGFCGVMP